MLVKEKLIRYIVERKESIQRLMRVNLRVRGEKWGFITVSEKERRQRINSGKH